MAPTAQTVTMRYEQYPSRPGQAIYVVNASSVPIIVYSLALRKCENVREQCWVQPMDIRIGPNREEEVGRVEPRDPGKAYSFRTQFAWRADSSSTAALGALATAGDTHAGEALGATRRADARRRRRVGGQDLYLTRRDVDALADRVGSIRVLPDSIVLSPGATMSTDTLRVLLVDTANEPLGRITSFRLRLLGDGVLRLVKRYSLVAGRPGRTVIQVRLNDDVLPTKPALHQITEVPVIVRR